MSYCKIIFFDVQHGCSTYIRTPNNKHILIDLGVGTHENSKIEFSPILFLKKKLKVNQLDSLIITHPHLDHIDDILNIDKVLPKTFYRPYWINKSLIMSNVKDIDKDKFNKYYGLNESYITPLPWHHEDKIHNPINTGGLQIKSFYPKKYSGPNLNNYSVLTVIEYGNNKIIIPGDNEFSSLDELMEQPNFCEAVRNADILLAPHHGRESGYNHKFVKLVNPKLTIVSDGRHCDTSANNRYSAMSRGMPVFNSQNNKRKTRHCLTTNSDGSVIVRFGIDVLGRSFINVNI